MGRLSPHAPAAGGPRDREGGFTLVMLVVMLAVMAILMTVAVQTVSFQMRREREAELIFRGNQYVEAIRLYKAKYGRLPMSLKEIWEANPHVIRKKWKDPITDSSNWGLVFLGQTGNAVQPGRGGGMPGQTPTPTPEPTPEPTPPPGGDEGAPAFGAPPQQTGPIVGVYSKSCDDSIRIVDGRTRYCDWKFVIPEAKPGAAGGAAGAGGQPWGVGGGGGSGHQRPSLTPRPGG
jgi:type II secretory pathway pseudopilin PulG